VWTDVGASEWSQPASWNGGLLDTAKDTITAGWIEPWEPVIPEPGNRPGYALRGDFTLPGDVVGATVFATAHGIYELFLNGQRVGDAELTPGFTSYRSRLQVQAFDVSSLITAGDNTMGILLTDGWFRGRHGFEREADGFGTRTAALAQLDLVHADGTTSRLGTDATWRSRASDILSADLMDGQHVSPTLSTGWTLPGFADPEPNEAGPNEAAWMPVTVATDGLYADRERLITSTAPPVRRIREVGPRSITPLADRAGSFVVDFGENLNGWVRLSNPGPAGTHLLLTHGEALASDGSVTTQNIRAFDFASGTPLPAGQVDSVISAGPADVFEPRHTTHGFQFVQVDGHPGELSPSDITAIVVHTDLETIGSFECSDDRITLLHDAGVRSFLGNACDIPTDCPQRERSGFTGDWQLYVGTAAFTHDIAGFSDKWLRDLSADQWASGVVPNIVPDPHGNGPTGRHFTDMTNGSAGWGDAAVMVPAELWRRYGDRDMLERQYPSMTAWVDFAARSAADHRHPDRAAAHPEPRPHERYLWDTGFHFGEWLEPDEIPSLDPARDNNGVATAYLAHSAELLAGIAATLGRRDDADRYATLSAGAKDAWRVEQLTATGELVLQSQAMHVRALAFGLLEPGQVQPVADRLAELVAEAGFHLGTGFLSTGMLLPTLADNGHLDTAYRLLFSTGIPSWLGMIDRGATTIWERWNGIEPDGTANGSLNHYSKGAVLGFLHEYIAGIRPGDLPGYRHLVIAPKPGGGITSASAHHDSPYGRITSRWSIEDGTFELTVEIPPSTAARIELPDGSSHDRTTGTHRFSVRAAGR
jgi:alpha-L-rhamnosidase